MPEILILCTGNTCRSPMGEGIFRKLISDRGLSGWTVKSAGLAAFPGDAITAQAAEALEEIGIDLRDHRARRISPADLQSADRIYVMTQDHQAFLAAVYPETADKITVLGVLDPFGKPIEEYRKCRDALLEFFTEELNRL